MCLRYIFHEGCQTIWQIRNQIFWPLLFYLRRCCQVLNPKSAWNYPMKNIIFMQKSKPLQNLIAYQLLVLLALYDCRLGKDLSKLQVEVEDCINFMMIRLDLPSFRGFFMDNLMATCDIFMVDWSEQIYLSEDWKFDSLRAGY